MGDKDEELIRRMREEQARQRKSKDLAERRAAKQREDQAKKDLERLRAEKRKKQDQEALKAFDRAKRSHKGADKRKDKNKSGGFCGVMVLGGLATFAVAAVGAVRAVV
jgi:Flp pilus assembly protein TadB